VGTKTDKPQQHTVLCEKYADWTDSKVQCTTMLLIQHKSHVCLYMTYCAKGLALQGWVNVDASGLYSAHQSPKGAASAPAPLVECVSALVCCAPVDVHN
jgi:hypothetical protein